MADTQRTLSALLAILADNTGGNISPQDLRDAVVTVFANYADIRTTSATNYTASTSWTKLPFAADGLSAGCVTANAASDRVSVSVTGVYRATLNIAVAPATTYNEFRLEVNAGGSAAGTAGSARAYAASTRTTLTLETLLSLTAGDYVEAFVLANAFSVSNSLEMGSLRLERVG